MSRKKKHEHVNHERWLVSYADFITLLFAFFVVLFASGQADKKKQTQLAVSIKSAFNQMGIFDPHTKLPPLTDAPGAKAAAESLPVAIPLLEMEREAQVKARLDDVAAKQIGLGTISVRETSDGLVVSLEEAGFFESGAAEVRPDALPLLDKIAATLPAGGLRVEGHTDNIPIRTAQFASNWELSSARACNIAHLLLRHPNIQAQKFSVSGYAEFHPVASNATEEGRAKNRRVDLVILRR